MSASLSPGQLSIAPLGAGDLIDRAVRLYRRHLFVLIRTAAPPVIIAAAGWIGFSIAIRRVVNTSDTDTLLVYIIVSIVSFGVIAGGYLSTLVVMGGATRTLVAHLLNNEPVTARATYAAVRARFWGLLAASSPLIIWILMAMAGRRNSMVSGLKMAVTLSSTNRGTSYTFAMAAPPLPARSSALEAWTR